MRAFTLLVLIGCGMDVIPAEDPATQSLVFGLDDRHEPFAITDPVATGMAHATVGLVATASLQATSQGWSLLSPGSLASSKGVCPQERYADQPTGPFCSGVLVGPDQILTADTCIQPSTCGQTSMVFGFAMIDAADATTHFPDADVYPCDSVESGPGWSLVTLDRPVLARTPVDVRRSGAPSVGTPVSFTGHPAGLPMKIVDGATIRTLNHDTFGANLDLYAGSTGGPVFDSATGVVEGIVADGPQDWLWDGSCYVSNICNDSGCPELQQVTQAHVFAHALPACADTNNDPLEAIALGADHLADTCAGDEDWYTVAAVAGEPVHIDILTDSPVNAAMWFEGQPIGSVQTTGEGLQLDATPARDGSIRFVVQGDTVATDYLIALDMRRLDTIIDAPDTMQAGSTGTWTVLDAVPWQEVVVLYGQPGSSTIPGCGGLTLGLDDPDVLAVTHADGDGNAVIQRRIPAVARGRVGTFYAVSRSSCLISAPTTISFY